jgi:hypothetical protein
LQAHLLKKLEGVFCRLGSIARLACENDVFGVMGSALAEWNEVIDFVGLIKRHEAVIALPFLLVEVPLDIVGFEFSFRSATSGLYG